MLLTDANLRGAKPRSKPYRLRDGDGLQLVIRPSGIKCWQLRYRFADCEKTLSLGKYPLVSLSSARDKKIEAKKLLDRGIDPSGEKRKEKIKAAFQHRNTFEAVMEEWLERNSSVWTPKHAKKVKSRIENHLLPKLGKRPIADIEPLDLLRTIQQIEAKGKTHMSKRVLQIAGSIFNYAIITGRAKYNITVGLSQALKPHKVNHYPSLSERELPEFFNALRKVETSEQNKLAMLLLMLTAVRTGEMRYSKWRDFDFNRREWRIPAEITKMRTEHIVPLSTQTIQILSRLHEISGDQEWLLPNHQARVHPVMSENTINSVINRMGFQGRTVGHGFRSLFSTVLNERGFNRDVIERQLAHMERDSVRAAYNRAQYLDQRRDLMQWWGDFLAVKEGTSSPFVAIQRCNSSMSEAFQHTPRDPGLSGLLA